MSGEVGERGRFIYFDTQYHPGHRDRALGSRGAQRQDVPHDPRGFRELGRQGPGAAIPRSQQALTWQTLRPTGSRRSYLIETPLDPARCRRGDGGRAVLRHVHPRRRRDRCAAPTRACHRHGDRRVAVGRDTELAERVAVAQRHRAARIAGRASRFRFLVRMSAPIWRRWHRPWQAISTISARSRAQAGDDQLPATYRMRFALPKQGIGARASDRRGAGALVGSIIKPNVGLSAEETRSWSARLCAAGVDFIKDDEISADPDARAAGERIPP